MLLPMYAKYRSSNRGDLRGGRSNSRGARLADAPRRVHTRVAAFHVRV